MTVLTYKWLNVLIQNDHIIIALEKTPIVFKKKKSIFIIIKCHLFLLNVSEKNGRWQTMLCLLRLSYINSSFSGQHSCESLDSYSFTINYLKLCKFHL